jgi:hypothetical protein
MKLSSCAVMASVLLVFAGTGIAAAPQNSAARTKSVSPGIWGGEHARMEVNEHGATLDFECATAEISEPLVLDGDGRFHAKGTFQAQGPGPSRDLDSAHPNADFSGKVTGGQLELQMKIDGESDSHSYTLVRGRQTRLRTCK